MEEEEKKSEDLLSDINFEQGDAVIVFTKDHKLLLKYQQNFATNPTSAIQLANVVLAFISEPKNIEYMINTLQNDIQVEETDI